MTLVSSERGADRLHRDERLASRYGLGGTVWGRNFAGAFGVGGLSRHALRECPYLPGRGGGATGAGGGAVGAADPLGARSGGDA